MANTKISELPAAATINGPELVPVVQGGVSSRTTASGLLASTTTAITNETNRATAAEDALTASLDDKADSSEVTDAVATRLALTGGTMTGPIVESLAAAVTTGSPRTLDFSVAAGHNHTLDAATTFNFAGAVAGKLCSIMVWVRQDATGGRVPTFTGVRWSNGSAPSWSTAAGAYDIVSFFTIDGGATIAGVLLGVGFA